MDMGKEIGSQTEQELKKEKIKRLNKKHNVHMLNSNNIGRNVLTIEH